MDTDALKQAALDAIDLPIYVLDRDLRVVLANESLRRQCRLYGLDPDVIGKPYHIAFPFLIEGTGDLYARLFSIGQSEISHHVTEIAGKALSVEVMRYPVRENGRVTHVVVVARDTTVERRLEKSLRDSEATARALINASCEAIILVDVDGIILTLNEIAAHRIGRRASEAIGLASESLFSKEEWRHELARLKQVIASREPVRFGSVRFGRTVDTTLCPIMDADGSIHRIAIFENDVTDREAALAALRQSEETARALMNASSESMLLIDIDGRIITLNETAAARIGGQVKDVVGRNGADVFPPEIWEGRIAGIRKIAKERTPLRYLDKRNGRTLDASLFPVLDAHGEVTGVAVFAQDVTTQEEALLALRESEETTRALINASAESIILMSPGGQVITLNEIAAQRVNLSVAEAIGRNGKEIFSPEIWAERMKYIEELMQTKQPVRFTDSRFGKTLSVSLYPVSDAEGEVQRIAIYASDITEHLEAMEALRASEERYRRQFESFPLPTFVWEKSNDDFVLRSFNRSALILTDGAVPRFLGMAASQMYADRSDIVQDMLTCASTGQSFQRELHYRFVTTEKQRSILAHYVFVPPNQVLVHAIDLTEQKIAQAALQNAQRTLELEVTKRTEELAQANEQLNVEREALDRKNIALQQVIEQASRSRHNLAEQIQANVERIVLPILDRLEPRLDSTGQHHLALARSSLMDVVSPYVRSLETKSPNLTSREIELCNLIRSGRSTKDIAALRHTSVLTVLTQRKIIRRKLGIMGKQINLASYLVSLMSEDRSDTWGE